MELFGSFLDRVFKNFSKDKCSFFKSARLHLPVVIRGCFLLIGSYPNGRCFPCFICPVQVLGKFRVFISLTLNGSSGRGHANFRQNDCIYPVVEGKRGIPY